MVKTVGTIVVGVLAAGLIIYGVGKVNKSAGNALAGKIGG